MFAAILTVALSPLLVAAEPRLAPGTDLVYRGSVARMQQDRTPGEVEKSFDLRLVVGDAQEGAAELYWLVEERGRGGWPWIERFGRLALEREGRPAEAAGPALLYDLDGSSSVIVLPLPLITLPEKLAAGSVWEEGGWRYEVQKRTPFEQRDTWQIEVRNNYGPKRTLWVADNTRWAIGINERVFMGMGEEYQLQLRLVGQSELADDARRQAVDAFEALEGLRTKLGRAARSEAGGFTPKQLATLQADLPAIEERARGTLLHKLMHAAQQDLELQAGRATAVDRLAAEQVGRAVPAFRVETVGGGTLSEADLKGHVTVLHFWDYREAPLKEPYGQVGYLDFLAQRRQADGVKVYGVAVDGRLADESQRTLALRGIRKLRSFMNLSYPIALDEGSLIKKFGDPRLLGAELPLFVVISPQGKIVHYHVGHYEVDRNEGLKELNQAVTDALGKKVLPP